jgi:carbonic anhydrase
MVIHYLKELIAKIEENNQMFTKEKLEILEKMTNAQHPKITLLTCSDSRVDIQYFKIDPLDKVFTIKNI